MNNQKPGLRRVNKKEWREQAAHPYSFEELDHFYEVCYEIYRQIVHQRPDLIIAPLRGSDPIIKTVLLIASLERKSKLIPKIVYPRTGEQTDIPFQRGYASVPAKLREAMTEDQKQKELLALVGPKIEACKPGHALKLFLVDEAFSGGSISQHYRLLENLIREKGWRVRMRAISVASRPVPKSSGYRRLVNAKKIREFSVPWLFTTDSPLFLHPLIGSKKTFMAWLQRKVMRPVPAMSRRALWGRQQLFSDVEALWVGKDYRSSGLNRLPMNKPRMQQRPKK
ncbi:MAG: hypothetical protein V1777_01135 [Candidatus Micrarchaeota archaeon]